MSKSSVRSISGKYPITALKTCVFADGVQHLLYGAGSELCITTCEGDTPSKFAISSSDSVHGIRVYGRIGLVAAYGGKSLLVVVKKHGAYQALACCQQLDDMILDFFVPADGSCDGLSGADGALDCVIGYAHNFVDIAEIKIGSNNYVCKRRIQCPDASVLFNMTIYHNSIPDHITIASGTVFGKIILWGMTPTAPAGVVHTVASDHEGVIFGIKWSAEGDRMISVSDDRTVRMWQVSKSSIGAYHVATGLQLMFTGWGHISRVWDAVFLNDQSLNNDALDCEIATCSEDGTVKLWNHQGQCTATLCGHNSDVWRLTTAHAGSVIVSGGNDSSIKMWDVAYQRNVAPEDSSSTLVSVPIPMWCDASVMDGTAVPDNDGTSAVPNSSSDDAVGNNDLPISEAPQDATEESVLGGMDVTELSKPKKKKTSTASRRANGVCSVRISPCLRWLVVVLVEGGIWLVQFSNEQKSLTDSTWIQVMHLKSVISTMDTHFVYPAAGSSMNRPVVVKLLVSHLNGENRSISVSVGGSAQSDSELTAIIESQAVWKAHDFRTVNIWFASRDASIAATATVKGACALWKLDDATDGKPQLLCTCTTPGKEIATACALIERGLSSGYLVLGDARGSVSVYVLPASHTTAEAPLLPTATFMKVHGTDPVSCIEQHSEGFVTGGHDGMVHVFQEVFSVDGNLSWLHTSKLNCLPISTPDQIIIDNDAGQGLGLYVCGYHGSAFMIWDLRRGYQIMRVEGGGWKRPHCSMLSSFRSPSAVPLIKGLPSVMFVCPAPLLKGNTVLQIFSAKPKLHAVADAQVSHVALLPLHVGSAGLGRVAYCATFITAEHSASSSQLRSSHIVVGGEDSCVKVLSVPDLVLQQEVSLSLNSSMKALASARSGVSAIRGIVVGGGGKLLYYIWLFDDSRSACASAHVTDSQDSLGTVLYTGVEGSIWAKATQDHRILSVQCAYLESATSLSVKHHPVGISVERYMVLLCDSRGSATLGLFEHAPQASVRHVQFSVLQQLQPSQCPVLSSALLIAPDKTVFTVFGDTVGVISVWGSRQNTEHDDAVSPARYYLFLL